jgi:hypothetical protein
MTTEHIHNQRHAVQFYSDDSSLCRRVASFLSDGMAVGGPAIVIATATHQDGIVSELGALMVDVAYARRAGELVLLDADETLGACMIDGNPDPFLFHSYIGTVIEQVGKGRRRTEIRAYGEMVDVLWRAGQADAAIQLEILWNALTTKYPVSLLCGYGIGQFHNQPDLYHQVCQQHTAVFDIGGDSLPPTPRPASIL